MMRKILKITGISILAIISLIIISGTTFIRCSPQFGRGISKQQKTGYEKLENYKDGKFINQHPSPMNVNYWKIFKELLSNDSKRQPNKNINVEKVDTIQFYSFDNNRPKLIWLGHSSFLLKIEDKTILIDPMFSKRPSPISFLGTKRYSTEMPISIEELPKIDAVILSHDHYDHLDYETIIILKNKTEKFFVPLGVDSYLIEWGVSSENIISLNWWEDAQFDSLKLICTPARHFSGRGLFDRATTLWCSWVIQGKNDNIFFGGDSGYDTHFKEIGEKYGPFDISLMECGQYNEDWKLLHMMPEETAQAGIDLKSKLILPIHWGSFTLAFHEWTDPIERIILKAEELNIPVTTPKIGEIIILSDENYPTKKWWREYMESITTNNNIK